MKKPTTSKVQIQYMSDLHLERVKYNYSITPIAPILILGGDIGRFCDYLAYRAFLATLCTSFHAILLVAGNHEFYGSSREDGLEAAMKLVDEPCMNGRLHFLNRGRFDVPESNVTVLGCTLHSHIGEGYTSLTNDFERTQEWSVKKHNAEHRKDLEWLKGSLQEIREADGKNREVVIVTHYAPMFERVCHPLNENNAVSQCFSSRAREDLRLAGELENVSYWIFGHTHWNVKFKVEGLVVASNQLCNDKQKLSWWQRKTIYRAFDSGAVLSI